MILLMSFYLHLSQSHVIMHRWQLQFSVKNWAILPRTALQSNFIVWHFTAPWCGNIFLEFYLQMSEVIGTTWQSLHTSFIKSHRCHNSAYFLSCKSLDTFYHFQNIIHIYSINLTWTYPAKEVQYGWKLQPLALIINTFILFYHCNMIIEKKRNSFLFFVNVASPLDVSVQWNRITWIIRLQSGYKYSYLANPIFPNQPLLIWVISLNVPLHLFSLTGLCWLFQDGV